MSKVHSPYSAAEGLRMLTNPAVTNAKMFCCIAIAVGEIVGISICSFFDQKTECGAMGGGMCGYIFTGVLLTLLTLMTILLPETIVAQIIRAHKRQGAIDIVVGESTTAASQNASALPYIKKLRGTVIIGCLFFFVSILSHAALVCAQLLYSSQFDQVVCRPSAVLIAFVVSITIRLGSTIAFFIIWILWLSKINVIISGFTRIAPSAPVSSGAKRP